MFDPYRVPPFQEISFQRFENIARGQNDLRALGYRFWTLALILKPVIVFLCPNFDKNLVKAK